jgi:hypothetical protein
MYRKAVFSIEGFDKAFIGYTDGTRWNGWAEPFFEIDEAFTIMQKNNVDGATPIFYMEATDSFVFVEEEPYEVKGRNFMTEDGLKHIYGIGAGCWVWDKEEPKRIAKCIAEQMLDNVFDNNPWLLDCYIFNPDVLEKKLIKEFADICKFRDVVTIFYDEDLNLEEKIAQLTEVLKWK